MRWASILGISPPKKFPSVPLGDTGTSPASFHNFPIPFPGVTQTSLENRTDVPDQLPAARASCHSADSSLGPWLCFWIDGESALASLLSTSLISRRNPAVKADHVTMYSPTNRMRAPGTVAGMPAPPCQTCDEIARTSRFACGVLFFSLPHHFTSSPIHPSLWYGPAFSASPHYISLQASDLTL